MRSRLALLLIPVLCGGCTTIAAEKQVVRENNLTIKLRAEKKLFGDVVEQGYQHPAVISAARLENILGRIEVDTRKKKKSKIRQRREAIPDQLLPKVSDALGRAYAEAGPNQSIVVLALRKQMQHGIFQRKFLTSFVTYMKDDQLFVFMSRVDWPIEEHYKNAKLPEPRPNDEVMNLTAVTNPTFKPAGSQGVRVDWRDPTFGALLQTAAPAVDDPPETTEPGQAATERSLEDLSPDSLRRLADLEEAHDAGQIDAAEYQRRRTEILSAP